MNLKEKNYLYVNITTQRCANKIIKKTFLIEDFFHLPPVSMTPVVHLGTQGFGGNLFMKKTWCRKSRGTVPLKTWLQNADLAPFGPIRIRILLLKIIFFRIWNNRTPPPSFSKFWFLLRITGESFCTRICSVKEAEDPNPDPDQRKGPATMPTIKFKHLVANTILQILNIFYSISTKKFVCQILLVSLWFFTLVACNKIIVKRWEKQKKV